jgi:hypothetical protein
MDMSDRWRLRKKGNDNGRYKTGWGCKCPIICDKAEKMFVREEIVES